MIKEAIEKIVSKQDLTYDEAYTVMNEIMTGQTTPTQNAAFLAALSTKSTRAETIDEISGCAQAMRNGRRRSSLGACDGDRRHRRRPRNHLQHFHLFCLCGGGGRVKIAKHGNGQHPPAAAPLIFWKLPAPTSSRIRNSAQDAERGRNVLPLRTEVPHLDEICRQHPAGAWHRTVFNILGPLTNPAKPGRFLLGVYDEYLVGPLARSFPASV